MNSGQIGEYKYRMLPNWLEVRQEGGPILIIHKKHVGGIRVDLQEEMARLVLGYPVEYALVLEGPKDEVLRFVHEVLAWAALWR